MADIPAGVTAGNGAEVNHERARMRTRAASSVRFRLTAAVMLVVGLSLLGGGTLLVKWVEATLTNDLRSRNERILVSMADSLNQGQVPAELFSTPSELQSQIDSGMSDSFLGRARDLEEVISTTYFYLDGQAFSQLKVRGVDAEGRLVLFGRDGPALPDAAAAIEVTRNVPTRWGDMTIHAVSPLAEIERSVGALRAALWIGLPLLVLAAGAMTWFITGQTLAPVAAMTRRVRELSSTNLDARVPVPPTDDEIALLARTMNDMLDRLEKASVKQRQFVSDASHELRSPVASIRTQLETALRYPDDVDWPSVARVVLAEDDRLDHLVGNLLAMARLEEGRFGPRGPHGERQRPQEDGETRADGPAHRSSSRATRTATHRPGFRGPRKDGSACQHWCVAYRTRAGGRYAYRGVRRALSSLQEASPTSSCRNARMAARSGRTSALLRPRRCASIASRIGMAASSCSHAVGSVLRASPA